ncbi:hypothetical protein BDY21DRAFT_270287, partial [Lineolata rhizophorae]
APDSSSHRERSSSVAPSRKRKARDDLHVRHIEPPRQRHKSDGPAKDGMSGHGLRNPTSPATPNIRSTHKRSVSTQSVVPASQSRKRREVQNLVIQDRNFDSGSDDEYPQPQSGSVNPQSTRLKRSAQRSLVSPVRAVPAVKKNTDRFGATRLARECEKGDLTTVKQAYHAAPDELDQQDFAGISPLQKAALNGHVAVVEFLIDRGCRTDCKSKDDRDTPLIDAVENGHVEVVKVLLEKARVNPHHQNRRGQRAIDVVNDDEPEAPQMKEELNKAMMREGPEEDDSAQAGGSQKVTGNLLYSEFNTETLRDKAAVGDAAAVSELLSSNIMPNNACGVAAARGGYDDLLSIFIAYGLKADIDPSKHSETPMTVAIGRGHIGVIKLLLSQDGFDPTRRNKNGKTYWELAEERRGPKWQLERDLLKQAYEDFRSRMSPRAKKKQQPAASSSREKDQARAKSSARERERASSPLATGKHSKEQHPSTSPLPKQRARLISGKEKTNRELKRRRRVVDEEDDESSESDEESRPSTTSSKTATAGTASGREKEKDRQPPLKRRTHSDDAKVRDKDRDREHRVKEKERAREKTRVKEDKEKSESKTATPKATSPDPPRRREREKERERERLEKEKREKDEAAAREREAKAAAERAAAEQRERERREAEEKAEQARREAEERARREAEERARREAEEKARREAEEKAKREAEEKARREAEEKARREAEERERQERERKEREERERKEREEREERERQERERKAREREQRLDKLPRVLARALRLGPHRPLHFSGREMGISASFLPVYTARLADIDPSAPAERRDERWMPSFQAVGILGLHEPDLAEFPAWEKREFTPALRRRFLRGYDIRQLAEDQRFVPEGMAGYDPDAIAHRLREATEQFLSMEPLWWVK